MLRAAQEAPSSEDSGYASSCYEGGDIDYSGFPPADYDYSRSTEDNYSTDEVIAEGPFAEHRNKMDYSYHKHYTAKRQELQDHVMRRFLRTRVMDGSVVCSTPTQPWIVFTAGPMGAGKSHTMMWLKKHGYFPLEGFVHVDPDKIREMLPESKEYLRRNRETAGMLTQKETGYCSEVLSRFALSLGKNVVVDGSLRHADWYAQYFQKLREEFPDIRIAILHIFASSDTVCARARSRAKDTGRYVPETILIQTIEQIPRSLKVLEPLADFVAEISNERSPELQRPSMSWEEFEDVWRQQCPPNFDPEAERRMFL